MSGESQRIRDAIPGFAQKLREESERSCAGTSKKPLTQAEAEARAREVARRVGAKESER